jgi:hypothetical protein
MGTQSRYDDIWRETIKTDTDDDGVGDTYREEKATITIPVQAERDRDELQRLTRGGDVPDGAIGLVVHMRHMEQNGYVNSDGDLAITKMDRLDKLVDKRGTTVDKFTTPQLFCHHVHRLQADIGRTSNLALLLFSDIRPVGLT